MSDLQSRRYALAMRMFRQSMGIKDDLAAASRRREAMRMLRAYTSDWLGIKPPEVFTVDQGKVTRYPTAKIQIIHPEA